MRWPRTWANRIGIPAAVLMFLLAQWANYDHLHRLPVSEWSRINGWTTLIVMSLVAPFFGYIFLGLWGYVIDLILEKNTR